MMKYVDYRFKRVLHAVKAISPFEDKEWLDLGCHNGSFAKLLCSHRLHVTGIDVYDPNLKSEQSWNYIQCDLNAKSLPIENCSFDVVSALELIEHIIDTDRFLKEVHRVLRPKGLFALSTPNINMLRNRIGVLLGSYPQGLEYKNVIHHVRLYNLRNLISQLKEHNFAILFASGEKFLPQRFLNKNCTRTISEILAKAFPTLCSNLFLVCRSVNYK